MDLKIFKRGSNVLFLSSVLLLTTPLFSKEYFVSKDGSDLNSGDVSNSAFATLQKGISILKAGDILTILPGDYQENIAAQISGLPDKPITIRAARPGTVSISGCIDAAKDSFRKHGDARFTYECDIDLKLQGVAEKNTLISYKSAPSIIDVEDTVSSYFHDETVQKLYIHTSNSSAPEKHNIVFFNNPEHGLIFTAPKGEKTVHDVIVDGLAFSGFLSKFQAPLPGGGSRWGLYFVEPERCIVRNCISFLNGGGIGMVRPKDCLIENCVSYGISTPFNSSGGNFICYTPGENTIERNNIAYASDRNGIRFYGGGTKNCFISNNISWGCEAGEIWIKGGDNSTGKIENNVSIGMIAMYGPAANVNNNFSNYISFHPTTSANDSNIQTSRTPVKTVEEFADPVNLDYRPQSDSKFRKTLPDGKDRGPYQYKDDVFFISSKGDDNAEGTSVKKAWKTIARALKNLKSGQSIYILPGKYDGDLNIKASGPLTLSSRGYGIVEISGKINISGVSDIKIRGIASKGINVSNCKNIELTNCIVRSGQDGLLVKNTEGLHVSHNIFADCAVSGIAVEKSSMIEISSNILSGNKKSAVKIDSHSATTLYSDYNSFFNNNTSCFNLDNTPFSLEEWKKSTGMEGHSIEVKPEFAGNSISNTFAFNGNGKFAAAIGPFHQFRQNKKDLEIIGPFIHSTSATTANIEWWTNIGNCSTELEWGETADCKNKAGNMFYGSAYHAVSLTGLQPGKTYFYRVTSKREPREYHSNPELGEQDRKKIREGVKSGVRTFETLKADLPSLTYHVAVNGSDTQDGSSLNRAFQTIRYAASKVKPGDTVIIHGGKYSESIPVRATGRKEKPITFTAAEGEKVLLDGKNQTLPCSFLLPEKSFINLNGFYLHDFYPNLPNSGIIIIGGENININRCLYDGRSATYTPPFIYANACKDLTVRNCVWTHAFHGTSFWKCPNLRIENCVLYMNQINSVFAYNLPEEKMILSHNIYVDNTAMKYRNPVVNVWQIECVEDEYNCYFMRKGEEKPLYGYNRIGGKIIEGGNKMTWKEFTEAFGQGKTSFFANPGMKIIKEILTFKGDDWESINQKNKIEEYKYNEKEKTFSPIDFEDFLSSNPKCMKAGDGRPIGLDPAAFKIQ